MRPLCALTPKPLQLRQDHVANAWVPLFDPPRDVLRDERQYKGYSHPFVRRMLRQRRIAPVIPTRSDREREEDFDREAYKRRNVAERLVGWFKERRRLCTR